MSNSNNPDSLTIALNQRRQLPKVWTFLAAILVTLASVTGLWLYLTPSTTRPLIGVWKATDEHGGQHFYEFQDNGKMLYWDVDRTDEPGLTAKRVPFHGIYHYEKDAIIAQAVGLFGPRVGSLRWEGRGALHQEFDGHTMRQNLTYNRVDETSR